MLRQKSSTRKIPLHKSKYNDETRKISYHDRLKSNHNIKLHNQKPSVSDFLENYTLFTYSNDKKSREFIGINHPAMQHMSVNDYMNLYDNAVSNLSSNLYKSKKEKENEIRESKYIWNQIHGVLNSPDTESASRYKTQQKQTRKITGNCRCFKLKHARAKNLPIIFPQRFGMKALSLVTMIFSISPAIAPVIAPPVVTAEKPSLFISMCDSL